MKHRWLVECVPNVSEGRDLARVDSIAAVVNATPGVLLLHRTSDPDHNRSVLTFAGPADAVSEAALRIAAKAAELIDLNHQSGVHPRLGALDVLPFVPLGDTTLQHCVELAHETGARIWNELHIPVYFYEAAALRPERVKLEKVRSGQFAAMKRTALWRDEKMPDIGGPGLHPTAGAVIVGARKILIAYNINLETDDINIAQTIAKRIRESSGGFRGIKALGLTLASQGIVQVSMNITDFEATPIHVVFLEVQRLAAECGVAIRNSELIGLLPRQALEMTTAAFLKLDDFDGQRVVETRLETVLAERDSIC